MGQKIKLQTLV